MRKVALIILTTLLTETAVFCQGIGFRGGLNFAKTGGDSKNISVKPDFHIGLFWSDYLTKKLAYHFDVTYSRQGGQGDPTVLEDFKINNNYVNISSLIGFDLDNRLKILLGPQMGIKINGRIKWADILDENQTDGLSLLNVSLASELQHQIGLRTLLYTRYAHGLTSNVSQQNLTDGKFPDRVIQIGIAVNVGNKQ